MTIIFVNDFFCKSSLIKVQIHRFKPKVYWCDSNYFSDLSQKVGFSLLWAKSWIFTDMSQKVGFSLIWAKKLNFHFYEPKVEFSLIWAKKFNFHWYEPKILPNLCLPLKLSWDLSILCSSSCLKIFIAKNSLYIIGKIFLIQFLPWVCW